MKVYSCFYWLFLTITILANAIPQSVSAQAVDPAITWKMIDTEHARFIFDAKHKKLATEYIAQFNSLAPAALELFGEAPRRPTILLVNNTDLANGSARVVPQPIVSIFPVVPAQHMTIGEYADSAYEVAFHEYTHILNMEPSHGVFVPLRWVFGSVARPNMMLPRWYTEGLAVYTESLYSPDGGRLNSEYLNGMVRALTLDQQWSEYPIGEINDPQPDWVGGSRPYFMGGLMWETIVADNGLEAIKTLNQNYSRRMPYLLDGPLKELYAKNMQLEGIGYDELLDRTKQRWAERAQRQMETVMKAPHLRGRTVRQPGFYNSFPSISPNGQYLAYVSRTFTDFKGSIQLMKRHPKKGFRDRPSQTVAKAPEAQTIAWHPSSRGFLFESLGAAGRYEEKYDLHYYDLKSKKSRRLTKGESASHPAFAPDGRAVFYIKNNLGGQELRRMPFIEPAAKKRKLEPREVTGELLYEPALGTQLIFLNCQDEKTLVFIEQLKGGKRQLVQLDVATKQKQVLLSGLEVNFVKKAGKEWLVGSPKSGIQNIYLVAGLGGGGEIKAITNTATHIRTADLDPISKDLYFEQFTGKGPRLFNHAAAQWESLADEPPVVEPLVTLQGPPRAPLNYEQANSYQEKEFSPWSYLVPNHWIPFFFIVDQGAVFQASSSAGDPLGINTVGLFGQWDTLTKKAGGALSYVNNSTPVGIGVGVSDLYSYFYASEQTLHSTGANGSLRFPVPYLTNGAFMFRWAYSQLNIDGSSSNLIRQGPGLTFSYSDLTRGGRAISTESGWSALLSHRHFLPDLGNIAYRETQVNLSTFWSSFTPGRSVFYLGANYSVVPKSDALPSVYATSTLAGPFNNVQAVNTAFLQRGYPSGSFLAREIVNLNGEFRFPLWHAYTGFRSPPVFLQNLAAHLVFDASALDGLRASVSSNSTVPTEKNNWFTGYGVELHTSTTLGFHVPVSFILGLYFGENQDAGGELTPFFSLQF